VVTKIAWGWLNPSGELNVCVLVSWRYACKMGYLTTALLLCKTGKLN